MCFKNTLAQGWGGVWGYGQSVFLSTGVGGGFKNGYFGAYVLYGWPLVKYNSSSNERALDMRRNKVTIQI